jgi:hypothetical protein
VASDVKRGLNLTRVGTLIQQCELQFRLITEYAILNLIFLWCLTLIRFGNYFFPLLDISFLQQTTLSSSLYRLRQHFEFDSTNFSINLKDFLFWFIMNCITVGHIFITAIRDDRPQSRPHYAKSEGHTTYQICKKKKNRGCPSESFSKNVFQPYRPRQMYT